jgi:hypothetical protein
MISIQKLLGKDDQFFDLLEASATEAHTSIKALSKYLAHPEMLTRMDEFIATRRKDKAITSRISEALCTTFVTALEREDIEALSSALYKIPKTVEKIAERIMLAPQFLVGIELASHLALLEKAGETVVTMIKELRRGNHLERIRMHNDQLQGIEGEADKKLLELLGLIYKHPNEVVRALFLKDIFELLENIFDRCRDAGNVITHIVLKSS